MGTGRVSEVDCGTGAAGGSWAQPAIVSIPNKITAVVSRMVEAMRANGIYSSPFINNLQLKGLVLTRNNQNCPKIKLCTDVNT
jgi:hypothetical protein